MTAPTKSSNKIPLLIGGGVVAVAVLAWLAFGFFGIQTAFLDSEVSESADGLFDTATASVEEVAEEAEVPAEQEAETQEVEVVAEEAPAEEVVEEAPAEEVVEEAPAEEVVEEAPAEEVVEEAPAEEAPAEEAPVEDPPAEEPVNEIFTAASGSFSSLNGYSVSGDALVLSNGTEQRFLRFENFVSDNGPDLKVYLRAADGSFVSLGDLSGNIGDQNYAIPADVDLSVFSNVEIWCERFSAGFGVATLS